ncbi:hypothetical protein BCR44DRAFT_1442275 [Catenaria anguillulae PL171]|uniref:Secreted protein n=1 Tax=Catenaria anguillulae PL171 TaxID=765915 RepID=A0A1Y2HA98_9FUNG|nr:hypothetical protein BCR44DRAFT_1442275 [Catenaria anguillulae PL171]
MFSFVFALFSFVDFLDCVVSRCTTVSCCLFSFVPYKHTCVFSGVCILRSDAFSFMFDVFECLASDGHHRPGKRSRVLGRRSDALPFPQKLRNVRSRLLSPLSPRQ